MNPQMGPQMNIEMSSELALAGSLTYRAARDH